MTTAPPTTAASNCSQGGYGVLRRRHDGGMTRSTTQQGAHLPRVAVYFLLSFVVIFVIVQRSIYHRIKEYIFTTHYNNFEDYEEILPILLPAHENNFTKSFEGEFEYAEHLPALLRIM